MNAREKITKARAGLVLDHPFFGALALRQTLVEDPGCRTAWTDGTTIGYNPTWIDSLPIDQVKGVLAHEVLHVALAHHARRQSRKPRKWNAATDYSLNDVLLASGFTLPPGALTGMGTDQSAETIYNSLPEEEGEGGNESGQGNGSDPGACGEVRDATGPNGQPASEADLAQAEAEAKVAVAQAAAVAKGCGKLPGALARLVSDVLEPKIDWRTELRRFLAEVAKNDYSWRKPNSRYAAQGLYLPALYSEEMPPIVVAVDTSGSIDNAILKQFASELQSVKVEGQAREVTVIYCDSEIQGEPRTFAPDDEIVLDAQGGGGTNFSPVFSWIDENGITPACLIYLTDLAGQFPKDAPSYPVLWASTDKHGCSAPFGEVVPLES